MKFIYKLYCLSILLFAIACSKTEKQNRLDDGFKVYTIQKGNNYCNNNTYDVISNRSNFDFLVIFDSSCIYKTNLESNQADINKLLGFSDCGSHHQTNSARFGWNWYEDQLNVYAYCYINGVRQYKKLSSLALNKQHHLKMYVEDKKYYFEVNGVLDSMPRFCSGYTISGYQLFPYFGGDETAPHDIFVSIKIFDSK